MCTKLSLHVKRCRRRQFDRALDVDIPGFSQMVQRDPAVMVRRSCVRVCDIRAEVASDLMFRKSSPASCRDPPRSGKDCPFARAGRDSEVADQQMLLEAGRTVRSRSRCRRRGDAHRDIGPRRS